MLWYAARMDPLEQGMRLALREARAALEHDDVPVGAVILGPDGQLLGRAHNQRELLKDPTAHAEMIAITQAASALGSWQLEGARLFVTLEPCAMCAGAIVLARIPAVVFGADDPKAGATGSLYNLLDDARLNHRAKVTGGVLADECAELLRTFFQEKRRAMN